MPRQFYTLDVKEAAVNLVNEGGLTVAKVGWRLSISPQTLHNWIKKHSTTGLKANGNHSVSELEAEGSKLRKELAEVEKVEAGINRIKRLQREMKIRCKQVKKYKATTDSNHKLPVAPNMLNQDFAVPGPNRA